MSYLTRKVYHACIASDNEKGNSGSTLTWPKTRRTVAAFDFISGKK